MNRKKTIIVGIFSIFIVLVLIFVITYGYLNSNIKGNTNENSVVVDLENSKIEFTDLSNNNIDKLIEPGFIDIKLFTVKNIGNTTATYNIYLGDVVNDFARPQDLQYTLYRKSGNNTIDTSNLSSSDIIASGKFPTKDLYIKTGETLSNQNDIYTYAFKVEYINSNENQDSNKGKVFSSKVQIDGEIDSEKLPPQLLADTIINSATTNANGTTYRSTPLTKPAEETTMLYSKGTEPTTFTQSRNTATNYYISYADDYTVDPATGKFTLVNPVVATSKYTTSNASSLAGKYAVWGTSVPSTSNTQNQSSIYKISTNVSDITSTIKYATINSNSLTKSSAESTLSTTSDDYGTSYYYRGNVTDNYVDFAGMCWRIVRIEGDGSIKLILEDQDSTCASSNGNWNIPTTTGGSTRTGNFGYTQYASGALTASNGTTTNSSTRYVMNYLNGGTNNASSMATAFKNFQTETLTTNIASTYNNATLNDYLKIDNWCMNDKGYSQSGSSGNYTYTELSVNEMLDKKVAGQIFYYDSYVRLYGKTIKEPTLNCNGTVMNKFGDNTTDMYVGTLTADEVTYAGGKYETSNSNYYLINDYQKTNNLNYWSLSPNNFSSGDIVFVVDSYGRVNNSYLVYNIIFCSFRPAVSLKSGTVYSDGDGSKTNAYTIE